MKSLDDLKVGDALLVRTREPIIDERGGTLVLTNEVSARVLQVEGDSVLLGFHENYGHLHDPGQNDRLLHRRALDACMICWLTE